MQPQNFLEKEKTRTPLVARSNLSISPMFISGMIIGIILLIVLVHIGFSRTYIQFFPKFKGFRAVQHFHGMMMMGWILMLLVQPILILKGNIKLHRRVGAISYVLAPLILLALYLANKDQYLNLLASAGQPAAVARLALSLPEAVFFAILYSLAIFHRHRPALHMRYMCSTAFLFINPALGRIFRTYFDFKNGFSLSSPIALSFVGLITIVDSLRTKRISPFTLVFGLMLLHRILWELRDAPFWQAIGSVIAKIF